MRLEGKSRQVIHRANKFYSKTCQRYFVVTTNTIFDNHKLPLSEWVDFCIGLFTNVSFSGVSRFNRNSYNTTKYWVNKLELLLRDYQENILLEKKVQIDETYYKCIKRDIEKIDKKEKRGLSTNQVCIGIGIGRDKKQIYCKMHITLTLDKVIRLSGYCYEPLGQI